MWLVGLLEACMPLWQVKQLPGVTPIWLKRAPEKLAVLWQVSHGCCVWMWLRGMTTAEMRVPATWHNAHWRGVPLKRPETWQDSQRVRRCCPVSGKPVCTWSNCVEGGCANARADSRAQTTTVSQSTTSIQVGRVRRVRVSFMTTSMCYRPGESGYRPSLGKRLHLLE